MSFIKHRKYCIIGFDNIPALKDAIIAISTSVNFMDSSNVMIATLDTELNPLEIKSALIDEIGSFFIFDLNPFSTALHVNDKSVEDSLFGNFNENQEKLKDLPLFGYRQDKDGKTKPIKDEDFNDTMNTLFDIFKKGSISMQLGPFEITDSDEIQNILNKIPFVTPDKVRPLTEEEEEMMLRELNKKMKSEKSDVGLMGYTEESLKELSKDEKNRIIDDILSRLPKLTDNERKILDILSS